MIGVVCLILFLVSLPWVWLDMFPSLSYKIRPALVFFIPLGIYFAFKVRGKLDLNFFRLIFVALVGLLIWIAPSYYNKYPHWTSGKVLTLYLYSIISYISARTYVHLFDSGLISKYWRLIGSLFALSCIYSFYKAFGSLVPNTDISSSTGFIYNSLYSSMFDDQQRGGKGIRHTMAEVPVLLLAFLVHNSGRHRITNSILFVTGAYLILYTFSRSAWLASVLIMIASRNIILHNFLRRLPKLFLGLLLLVSLFGIISIFYPKYLFWGLGIVADRVEDNASASGRMSALSRSVDDASMVDFLYGRNSVIQDSPHNFLFDAFMQSGIFGFLAAAVIAFYFVTVYSKGLYLGAGRHLVSAVFISPALVRIFTAGSGMLHIAELFGLFVAMEIGKLHKQPLRPGETLIRPRTFMASGVSEHV